MATGSAVSSADRNHADAAAFAIELDDAVFQRKQCVVGTLSYVQAGMELRADLPHKDEAGTH